MERHDTGYIEFLDIPKALKQQLVDLIKFKIIAYEESCDCDDCSNKRAHKINEVGRLVPESWVISPISHVPKITCENKFNWGDESSWEALGESGQYLFNYLFEFLERNESRVFATDIFKLDGFSNQQVMIVQKIIEAAKFNIATVAAEFVAEGQNLYDDEGDFNPTEE